MQTSTVHELKKELTLLSPDQLREICLRLAKFKKDNKELLSYLLFEAKNEEAYIQSIQHELDEQLSAIKTTNIYLLKKMLRRILRQLDKYIRYSGNKQTEAELRLHFLRKIKEGRLPVNQSRVLSNIYTGQLNKVKSAISKLHEDLQYDYGLELQALGHN